MLDSVVKAKKKYYPQTLLEDFFFYLGFLSRTLSIYRTAGEEGGYLFNFSQPLPPASQTLHIARNRTPTGNLWFLRESDNDSNDEKVMMNPMNNLLKVF